MHLVWYRKAQERETLGPGLPFVYGFLTEGQLPEEESVLYQFFKFVSKAQILGPKIISERKW